MIIDSPKRVPDWTATLHLYQKKEKFLSRKFVQDSPVFRRYNGRANASLKALRTTILHHLGPVGRETITQRLLCGSSSSLPQITETLRRHQTKPGHVKTSTLFILSISNILHVLRRVVPITTPRPDKQRPDCPGTPFSAVHLGILCHFLDISARNYHIKVAEFGLFTSVGRL